MPEELAMTSQPAKPRLFPPVADAWRALLAVIGEHTGTAPSILYGPKLDDGQYGRGVKVGATWFIPTDGRKINHHMSIVQYGKPPAVGLSWHIRVGRHTGPITDAAFIVHALPDLGLLRHIAGYAGLTQAVDEHRKTAAALADDLATVRDIAARARTNCEPIDPGYLLDIVGHPA
jgi:hypothetical protein